MTNTMRTRLPALLTLPILLTLSVQSPVINAEKLILYMDTITKQVYAEPGENRIKLGVFQQVEEEVTTAQPKSNTLATRHVESHTTKNAEQRTTAAQPEQTAKVTESSTEKSVAEKNGTTGSALRAIRNSATAGACGETKTIFPTGRIGQLIPIIPF